MKKSIFLALLMLLSINLYALSPVNVQMPDNSGNIYIIKGQLNDGGFLTGRWTVDCKDVYGFTTPELFIMNYNDEGVYNGAAEGQDGDLQISANFTNGKATGEFSIYNINDGKKISGVMDDSGVCKQLTVWAEAKADVIFVWNGIKWAFSKIIANGHSPAVRSSLPAWTPKWLLNTCKPEIPDLWTFIKQNAK